MTLPNYFLADLPREAALSPQTITDACQTLKRNREQYLRNRSTESLVRTISDVAASWLDPEFPFRRLAMAASPGLTGFPSATLAVGLDQFFRQLTVDHLQALLVQDLGHSQRLDRFVIAKSERGADRAALAKGPELLAHISAGNVPNPAFSSMILGILVRSAQFLKCASGTAYLPRLLAHSFYEADPKLASCLEIAEWPGGRHDLEGTLYREVDCLTATGSDKTLADIHSNLPPHLRFVSYGHRVSFGFIAREALGHGVGELVRRAASDVAAWNQLGCLSPHVFYVERGGKLSAEAFAEMLAAQLAQLEESQPRGPLVEEVAAVIASRRSFYEVRAAHSVETQQWVSPHSTAWTVVYEADPRFQLSCLHRFVYVKPVPDWSEILRVADSVRGCISTVGLEASEERAAEIAGGLARWGVGRVCPLGQMQSPPLGWRHDGRPSLGDLVTWTDWERPENGGF
ncbi:MAG: acyl-CoA reductase [Verrucomicrobiota bacterium]